MNYMAVCVFVFGCLSACDKKVEPPTVTEKTECIDGELWVVTDYGKFAKYTTNYTRVKC